MPEGRSKYQGLDGRAITKLARESIGSLGTEMALMAEYDQYPNEHRSRVRRERTAAVRQERADAGAALAAWAEAEAADAKRRIRANDVGTAAEESRRVADELRITRIVEASRANGTQRADAGDLAQRADRAYADGNLDEAHVLARAAGELAPVWLAEEVRALVTYDRMMADPAKARASRELDDIEVVVAAFDRDASASYSKAIQSAAKLAQAAGEHGAVAELRPEAARASIDGKMAAALGAIRFGGSYVEPEGVLPGLPQSFSRLGHVPAPDGARLPEPPR